MRSEIEIRQAGPGDALALAEFAAATFREAFHADNTAADMDAYTSDAFGERRQLQEIQRPDIDTRLATAGGEIVGYFQVWRDSAPACVDGQRPVEIRRLYVAAEWRGTGLAGRLMSVAADAARAAAADVVWLGVWQRNGRARAFYSKLGFRRAGTQTFVLGSDHQTDCILMAPTGVLSEAVAAWKDVS